MFAIPWHGHTVVGTTDTPIPAPALEPLPLDEEIAFIHDTAGTACRTLDHRPVGRRLPLGAELPQDRA